MYRLLSAHGAVAERRKVARARSFAAPELLATEPNRVWSWDISKLRSAEKWTYYYLYVVMDIFSRKIVGWSVYLQETGLLAETLISKAVEDEKIKPGQLTVHTVTGAAL
jgi:putative transposase